MITLSRARRFPNFEEVRLDPIRWPNFTAGELACMEGDYYDRTPCRHCGGEYYHSPAFLDGLQTMRRALGRPMYFNSGHRCAQSNVRVGGILTSPHLGIAVDLSLHNHNRFEAEDAAKRAGFTGFGYYKNMLHLDKGDARQWFGKGARERWI